MKFHTKKKIAPIIISVIIVLYYGAFGLFLVFSKDVPLIIKILGGILPLFLIGIMVYVLLQRIKEIESGEEDDLSKY